MRRSCPRGRPSPRRSRIMRPHYGQAAAEWLGPQRPAPRLWTGDQLAAARVDTGARFDKTSTDTDTVNVGGSGRSRWWHRQRRGLVTDQVVLTTSAREFLLASIRRD